MPGFTLIAGDAALDLVNTVAWRGDPGRTVDRLDDPGALTRWAVRAGITPHPVTADAQALEDVRTLREALHAHVTHPTRATTGELRPWLTDAVARATPAPGPPLTWGLAVRTAADLAPALALRALSLLQSAEAERIGTCADPACGWLFLDRTRNHSRRWCSSADCGNRDRASRHAARRRHRDG